MQKIEDEKLKTEAEQKQKTENSKQEETAKITVSRDAEKQILKIMTRVNDGFDAGQVSRQDVATWLIEGAAKIFSNDDVRLMRAEHFNEFTLLEQLLKKGREDGKLPPELRQVLRAQLGLDAPGKIKAKAKLTNEYINDVNASQEFKIE